MQQKLQNTGYNKILIGQLTLFLLLFLSFLYFLLSALLVLFSPAGWHCTTVFVQLKVYLGERAEFFMVGEDEDYYYYYFGTEWVEELYYFPSGDELQ